jgi:hypothetical protein
VGIPFSFNSTPFEVNLIIAWKNDIKTNTISVLNSPYKWEPILATYDEVNYHNCGWGEKAKVESQSSYKIKNLPAYVIVQLAHIVKRTFNGFMFLLCKLKKLKSYICCIHILTTFIKSYKKPYQFSYWIVDVGNFCILKR